MKLSPPKKVTFWVAVVIGLVGLVAQLGQIPMVFPFAFWLVVVAFVLLALGNLLEGL